ncbi:hypothetical protein IEQ34_008527 [Dendrobium chrysotoxum]|uniref:Uncharacterized protein n=1 Tax=Dendrobium chrysotoxum TaxID=161865 RepID=A0AAV7GZG5_DENCH|nr:hypothetical protein IEQ34_008527 [Dendrobium chrysotoxum]
MDEPFYQSNLLLDSVETPTFADYLLSPNDADMDFMSMTHQDTDVLAIWNSQDPNTGAFTVNQENPDETKMAHDRNTALSINSGSSPRIEERCSERSNVLSLENVDLNLNNTPVDDGQAFTQSSSPSNLSQSAEHSDNVEVSLCTSVPEFFEPERVPFSNSNADSSSGVVQVSEHYDRARNSVDAHRASLKRKNIEGVIGESSSSQKIAGDFSIPSSSKYLSAGCSQEKIGVQVSALYMEEILLNATPYLA